LLRIYSAMRLSWLYWRICHLSISTQFTCLRIILPVLQNSWSSYGPDKCLSVGHAFSHSVSYCSFGWPLSPQCRQRDEWKDESLGNSMTSLRGLLYLWYKSDS
jgi:hypothetical protein